MLSIFDRSPTLCDGLTRRAVLCAGGLGLLGLGPTGTPSVRGEVHLPARSTAKRCIVLFLMGGPPQHSLWDPKPDAPAEVRGEIDSIATNVPGVRIGELLSRTALHADKLAILRAVVTGDNAHSSSGYYMLTGVPHAPTNRENANPGAPNDWPTLGAVVQHLTGRDHGTLRRSDDRRVMPPAVRLPHHIFNTDGSVWPGQDSGWLGHVADPWLLKCEPAAADMSVAQFELSSDVTLDRFSSRQSLLSQFEARRREIDANSQFNVYGELQEQAFRLLGSAEARAACDLSQESEQTRAKYGRGQFGQSVLMARRMMEAGVEFVQVNWFRGADEPSNAPCWDSHANETKRLREALVPPFDLAFASLLSDLEDRGLLDETLVVCLAEFGRTPRFNGNAGRDHWGNVFSIVMAGGGIRGGCVHGRSDAQAAFPEEGIVHPQDITATMFHRLGYSPETLLHDPLGRPAPISRGDVIREIL